MPLEDIHLVEFKQYKDSECYIDKRTLKEHKKFYFPYEGNPQEYLTKLKILQHSLKGITSTVYIPYMPYLRQDKDKEHEVDIASNILTGLGSEFTNFVILDGHSEQAFNNAINEGAYNLFNHKIVWPIPSEALVVFPDESAKKRYGNLYPNNRIMEVSKIRISPGQSEIQSFTPTEVFEKAVIIDDMVDSGGTAKNIAKILKQKGTTTVTLYATHTVSKDINTVFENNYIDMLITTNSVFKEKHEKVLSLSAIKCLQDYEPKTI